MYTQESYSYSDIFAEECGEEKKADEILKRLVHTVSQPIF